MTNPIASEIVFNHIRTNPEAFLEALASNPAETQKAVLDYLQTLPEIGSDKAEQTNPTEETK